MLTTEWSAAALRELQPERQVRTYLGELAEAGFPGLGQTDTPAIPEFVPLSPSEVLLLVYELPASDGVSGLIRTSAWLWGIVERTRPNSQCNVDLSTLLDVTDAEPRPGFRWVSLDLLGVTVDEEKDFRPDIFIGRPTSSVIPRLEFAGGRRDPRDLAGVEVLAALAMLPCVTREAWASFTVVVPRIDTQHSGTDRGFTEYRLHSGTDSVHLDSHWWGSNLYGHALAVPTARALE